MEPVSDWEGREPSHPELLQWFVERVHRTRYDVKHLTRLILNSNAYQRKAIGEQQHRVTRAAILNAPDQRRLTAEQVIDSLFETTGGKWDVEELTFNPSGQNGLPTN